MIYRILVTGPGDYRRSTTRKRSDAALLYAERVAYDVIAGQAGLDTLWGHKAMNAVQAIDPRKGATVVIRDYVLYFTPSIGGAK